MYYHGQILWASLISPFIFEPHRDLEKQRESSASNIAKKKQEAEAAVSILQAYMCSSCGASPTRWFSIK